MDFLYSVAKDLIATYGTDLHNVTVVFPNKRASLFINRALAELSDAPLWSPQYVTVSDLFGQHSALAVADDIKLVCELHQSYCRVTRSTESLEQFYGWGQLMLADFDDIDKHLGDAKQIFTLLGDLHELDSVQYLTSEQQQILQRFFRHFTAEHNSQLKQRFLDLWSRFFDIYTDYRESLRSKGLAYEGMMYRDAIQNIRAGRTEGDGEELAYDDQHPTVFVGFNLLTPVEQLLITHMQGKVYADDDTSCPPETVSFISSPTDDLQARYVTQWLTPERIAAGRRTAIVLADEGLLETVLHCLPEGVTANVTTGYPLSKASVASFVSVLMPLLTGKRYTLHYVNAVLRHPLAHYISPLSVSLHKEINERMIYYLSPDDVSSDDNLSQLFAPLADSSDPVELTERLLWAVQTIAKNCDRKSKNGGGDGAEYDGDANDLTRESLYRMHTLLTRLLTLMKDEDISLSMSLYVKLLQQIIRTTSIPFHGEPIAGIQIMGVLETRNLDFDHVLLLSCNEGNLPAKIDDTSFLPHSVRQGYGLTTVENKVAIYHYYFDRLLQRASDVSIVYSVSGQRGKSGEMSRFMLQMLAEEKPRVSLYNLESSLATEHPLRSEAAKPADIADMLFHRRKYLSPSMLGKYLRCQMKFYFNYVLGLREDNTSDEEEMDAVALGNIFHRSAELLYSPFVGRAVPRSHVQSLLSERGYSTLRRYVQQAFREKLFNIPDDSRRPMPKLSGLQTVNFEMVVTFLINLLKHDSTLSALHIVGLEKEVSGTVAVETPQGIVDVKVGGWIDRLDMVTDAEGVAHLRVIDYKTGRLTQDLRIPTVEDIFSATPNPTAHRDYFLQALLYSYILLTAPQGKDIPDHYRNLPISAAVLYVHKADCPDYSPLLRVGKEPVTDASTYMEEFREGFANLINDIIDTSQPFRPTTNKQECRFCPFKDLCC